MPIEIRELHIKAVIDGSGGKGAVGNQNQTEEQMSGQPASGEGNMEGFIDACVEKVLEILKEKMER